MYLLWIRLEWAAMFRIFCEWEISKKISYLTHLIIALTKQKPFLAAALQNWHSWQFSLCSWRCWQNGTVTVGWQEAQELWSTHTLPCAAHLGAARAQMLPSTSGTLQSSGTGRSPRVCTSPFVLLESWVTILYLGSETNFHHLPLHGKRMSSSWGSICLQANKSLQIYFQRCQLVPYMVSSFMHIHFSPM